MNVLPEKMSISTSLVQNLNEDLANTWLLLSKMQMRAETKAFELDCCAADKLEEVQESAVDLLYSIKNTLYFVANAAEAQNTRLVLLLDSEQKYFIEQMNKNKVNVSCDLDQLFVDSGIDVAFRREKNLESIKSQIAESHKSIPSGKDSVLQKRTKLQNDRADMVTQLDQINKKIIEGDMNIAFCDLCIDPDNKTAASFVEKHKHLGELHIDI